MESFSSGWRMYTAKEKGPDTWLDVLSKSFWGMFGMVESITLPDLLDVEYLEIFGQERTLEMNQQAQVFWLLALYASTASTGIKIIRSFAYRAVPKTGGGYGMGEEPVKEAYSEKDAKKNPAKAAEKEAADEDKMKKEREQLKVIVEKRKEQRKTESSESGAQVKDLLLKLAADMLDMVIPATALGWLAPESGTIGSIMVITSILTSIDPWKRCGREMRNRSN